MYNGRGTYLYRLAPNLITMTGLCSGLFAISLAFSERWGAAVSCIIVSGIMDLFDGLVARLLRANSTFGAQLDSMCDLINFGVSPAMIVYMWGLHDVKFFGWTCTVVFISCMVLRLARFNTASIKSDREGEKRNPMKDMFFVGVPAPAGAMLALLPVILSIGGSYDQRLRPVEMQTYNFIIALLLVSPIATFSLKMLRINRKMIHIACLLVVLYTVCLITKPWVTVPVTCIGYIVSIPCSAILKIIINKLVKQKPTRG